jgi:hypothetical protein
MEIRGETAIAAPDEIHGEGTVMAILTEGQVPAIVGSVDAETLVTEFGIIQIGTIDAVLAALEQFPVITILTIFGRIDEIAIAAIPRASREVGILVGNNRECHPGHRFVQVRKLLEERPRKIKIPAVLDKITIVGMPLVRRIHLVWLPPERFLMNE